MVISTQSGGGNGAVASSQTEQQQQVDSQYHQQAAADLKSLELENGLLKNEVQSLNNELTSLIQRARNAEQGQYLLLLPYALMNCLFKTSIHVMACDSKSSHCEL